MKAHLCYANWHEMLKIPDNNQTFLSVAMDGDVLLDEEFYDHVFVCEKFSSPLQICDELFEQFSLGDKGGLHTRAMSVGDIVIIEYDLWTEAYVCITTGWRMIDLEDKSNSNLVKSLTK